MKHIDLYIADDGKQFDREEDCAMYEFTKRAEEGQFADRIKFYDANGKPIDVTDPEQYSDICCIIPKDEHILEEYEIAYWDCHLNHFFEDLPLFIPYHYGENGIFVYDDECDEWENLIVKAEQIQSELDFWKSRD